MKRAAKYATTPASTGRARLDDVERRLLGAGESATLEELTSGALATLGAAGLPFEELEVNAGWRRKPGADHLWYAADSGTGRSGRPWLMVTAGDAKRTGDVSTLIVVFRSWETAGAPLAPDEAADIQRQIDEAAQYRTAEDSEWRTTAANQARALWAGASEDAGGHAYLAAKQVGAHGVRLDRDRLLVPIADASGNLHGFQTIRPNGSKRFNSGASVVGHFHQIGRPNGCLYIAEGYATAATVHELTGEAVAIAFYAGNLEPAAKAIRQAHPRMELIVCADDDRDTAGNPGLAHARAAAAAVGGSVAVPRFQAPAPGLTDFDDLARLEGPETARAQLRQPEAVAHACTGLAIIRADTLHPQPIGWLWQGWLARGKVHVVAGPAGTGKTSLAGSFMATVTTGGRWPDGTQAEAGDVLMWSGEDDPEDTLVPRLLACGADLSRVHFVGGVSKDGQTRAFDPSRDAELLEASACAMNPPPALLIVDPLILAVAGDSHKNSEVRRALQPLVNMAARLRCAVLGITHFSKGTAGRDPVDRVTGSLAFGAVARVVLATAKLSDEDGGGRLLARAKNNLGLDTGGFVYDVEPVELTEHPGIHMTEHPGIHTTRVVWGPALEGTARDLLAKAETNQDSSERGALQDAKEFLAELLAAGPMPAKEVKRNADDAGHAERTVKRAKAALGVITKKDGTTGPWRWTLPTEVGQVSSKGATPNAWTPSADGGPLRESAGPIVEEFSSDVQQAVTRRNEAGVVTRSRGDRPPDVPELTNEDRAALSEAFEERAAIQQHEAALAISATEEAARAALRVYRYRLTDNPRAWLMLIAPGCELDEARSKLGAKFGARLLEVVQHSTRRPRG